MANVFGILTAIVLALAGFVAYQNKAAYEREIANTGNENDRAEAYKLGNNPSTPQKKYGELTNEKAKLGYTEGRLALAKSTYTATLDKRTAIDEEVVKLLANETDLTKTKNDLTAEKEALTAKIDANKSKSEGDSEKASSTGNLQEQVSKIRTLNTELGELTQSITAATTKLENLTALNNQTEAHANTIKKKFEIISSGQSLPTLKTQIRAIYPTWGFVTLACGNQGGVVANSTLEVVRDGATIAKLLVTSVETHSASASIIPDSLAQDVTLMIGDRVIAAIKPVKPEAPPKPVTPPPPAAPKPAEDPATPATEPAAPTAPEPAEPSTPDPLAPAAP